MSGGVLPQPVYVNSGRVRDQGPEALTRRDVLPKLPTPERQVLDVDDSGLCRHYSFSFGAEGRQCHQVAGGSRNSRTEGRDGGTQAAIFRMKM
jgi:hypothetical protein